MTPATGRVKRPTTVESSKVPSGRHPQRCRNIDATTSIRLKTQTLTSASARMFERPAACAVDPHTEPRLDREDRAGPESLSLRRRCSHRRPHILATITLLTCQRTNRSMAQQNAGFSAFQRASIQRGRFKHPPQGSVGQSPGPKPETNAVSNSGVNITQLSGLSRRS